MAGQMHRMPDLSDGDAPGVLKAAEMKFIAGIDPDDDKPVDLGDIGVDPTGIYLRRHIEMLVMEHERLWQPVDRFRSGFTEPREDLLSFERDAAVTLHWAHKRWEARAR